MRYVVGALLGAIIVVLPGIPAFTTWETADSKPALFDVYCDVDYWVGEADCPSGKTALVAGVGALVGLGGVTIGSIGARKRETSNSSETEPRDPK